MSSHFTDSASDTLQRATDHQLQSRRKYRRIDRTSGIVSGNEARLIDNQILTLRELAERLKISVSGLRKVLKRDSKFPVFRVGQQLRFDWSLVVAHLSKGEK